MATISRIAVSAVLSLVAAGGLAVSAEASSHSRHRVHSTHRVLHTSVRHWACSARSHRARPPRAHGAVCHLQRRSGSHTFASHSTAPGSASAATTSSCPGADSIPTAATIEQARDATVCLINNERVRAGLPALTVDARLQQAAQHHSADMVASDYFAHNSPSGESAALRVLRTGYAGPAVSYAIGENIAYGTIGLATPSSIVRAWMHSPGHRANILDGDYRQTGMGIVAQAPPSFSNGQAGAIYTQEFGVHG